MAMDSPLKNDIALVTGASRGIGRSIALELARCGATVIGTATSQTGATAISDYLAAAGLKGRGLVLDVGRQESVDAAMADDEGPPGPHCQHFIGGRRRRQRRPGQLCGGQGRYRRLFARSGQRGSVAG